MQDLTEDNIEAMYDMTYKTWVYARVAIILPENEWHYVDRCGSRTTSDNAFGRLCKHQLTYREWILHGDEVGTDTCQEDDGHIGGQVYLTMNG